MKIKKSTLKGTLVECKTPPYKYYWVYKSIYKRFPKKNDIILSSKLKTPRGIIMDHFMESIARVEAVKRTTKYFRKIMTYDLREVFCVLLMNGRIVRFSVNPGNIKDHLTFL